MEEFKIDRNQIIGFVLIGLIMIAFAWWSSSNTPEQVEQPTEVVTPAETQQEPVESTEMISGIDTARANEKVDTLAANNDQDTTYVLENQLLKLHVSSNGALITKAQLLNYQTWDSLPLFLIDSNQIMQFRLGKEVSTITQNYSGTTSSTDSSQSLTLIARDEKTGTQFEITYTLPDSSYQLAMNVNGTNVPSQNDLIIDWQIDAIRTEKSVKNERQQATIYYWQDDDYNSLSVRGDDDEEEENLKWIAYKQHFFSSIMDPHMPIKKSRMAIAEFEGEELTKRMKSESNLGPVSNSFNVPMTIYYGPNKYKTLKSYGTGYQDVIDFGWGIFGWIGKWVVIPIFNWLEQYGINYGIIILIMALMIKLVLFPLTYTSYKSMAKMRVLKPEIDEINEKYKDKDATKKNQAVMTLYQQAGVNPLGGCIPMLVQMPILIAMFRFFPASIELRQAKFLWANDLSTYDSIYSWSANIPLISEFYGNHISLFTILMTISTLAYTYLNSQMQGNSNQIPGMKYIMYGMPVMLLFWFNSYSAGLSYYYFVANIITFSQQFLIRRTIDDDAIHAKLQANKTKPKKKSKFQQRLAEMQDQQSKAKKKK